MKKWSLSIWLVFIGLVSFSQTTYQGRITDISGDIPIELVTIFFAGDNVPAESDPDGRYSISTNSTEAVSYTHLTLPTIYSV